jgi:DNA-binding response OmpR family regulator
MMPEINGVEVLKKVRETDDNLKVIMLTTCNQRDIVWECLDGKADDYLLKPISKNSLMDKLRMAKQ